MTMSGWSAGRAPLAMNVVTTGIWARSARARSSRAAWPRMTPFPARISGRSARFTMSAARASDGRSGDGRRGW